MLSLAARRTASICRVRLPHTRAWVPDNDTTDELGLPTRPVWSVRELLSSYATTPLSYQKLAHLHKLAALIPPVEGSPAAEKLQTDMTELIRLVEAVRLINTDGVEPENLLEPIVLSHTEDMPSATKSHSEPDVGGKELLQHAERTVTRFYIVDTPSTRRR
ncbi:hypothetical protein BKA62DRAFT_698231 [Auriculariales sp. MPI-PUGE-AT-0066]|nr:hypothetical protein BKA62DRAFT_698231 [Auriculariales sp. MPI-PUGE-AT-0066]